MSTKVVDFYFTSSLKRVRMIHKICSTVPGFIRPDSQSDIRGEVYNLIFTTSDRKNATNRPWYPLGRWIRAHQSIFGHGD
jgi:hypothetical protein